MSAARKVAGRLAFLVTSAAFLAVSGAPAPATPEYIAGVFVVTGTITLGANVPASDTLTVYVSIAQTNNEPPATATRLSQQALANPKVTRSGNTASFKATVSYRWLLDTTTASQVAASVSVTVSGGVSDTSSVIFVPLPANGSTTTVPVSLAM